MSDIVIKAENLGKKYTIGHQAEKGGYTALRDVLMQSAGSLWHKTKNLMQGKPVIQGNTMEEVWALKDVSFEIRRGEVVGIIGRNGAGKSTLLKVVSRITEPSAGRVTIKGRVASLLEVGTGFHPELTGRENIYLNGAIMGMARQEIKRKFDEIVAFAEVEKFLDTPVKRYSSGMYVRLAFAVAAHLEPEILLVDEVLAVGDAQFQKKCLGKMGEVAEEGRTVLFVSHNMGAISRLCNRALMLNGGELEKDGLSVDVISEYLQSGTKGGQHFLRSADPTVPLCLLEAKVFCSEANTATDSFPRHKPITVWMNYKVNRKISPVHVFSHILTSDGTIVFLTGDTDTKQSNLGLRKQGTYICQYKIPANILNEGAYSVNISFGIPYGVTFQANHHILTFRVVDVDTTECYLHKGRSGVVWLNIPWEYSANMILEE